MQTQPTQKAARLICHVRGNMNSSRLKLLFFIAVVFASTSCARIDGWWQYSGDSLTINKTKTTFGDTWFVYTDGNRNNRVCAIWNSYWGGNLLSSKLYLGKIEDNRASVYKNRDIYSIGETAWDYAEPLVLTFENRHMTVRLEPPQNMGSVRQIKFNTVEMPLKPTPDGTVNLKAKTPPSIDELAECKKALTLNQPDGK
jgi:hypothetical protein